MNRGTMGVSSLPKTVTRQMDIFRLLDTLNPTATGLDGIPAWFLRLGRLFSPRRYANSSISH